MRALLLALLLPPALSAAGSDACARCHRAIFESYVKTPMARSSGSATTGDRGEFLHAATGFRYRIYPDRGSLWFDFSSKDGTRHGAKSMPYFVGSGATARSYLLFDNGYAYVSPVTWYSRTRTWALTPGYENYAYPYLTRPVMPGCLICHASFLSPVPKTQNRYTEPVFGEGGVACERCHGGGTAHIASGGKILNPAKLTPDRRDSICSQCHLSGDARVFRPGNDWSSFTPGSRLSDSVSVFVKTAASPGITVTGHVEKLAQSACKRASGDRLWCGTCHDPHTVLPTVERASWFRAKCLTCHKTDDCKRAEGDCTGCHMPKVTTTDAQHVVLTDHSIPRRPRPAGAVPPDAPLVAFEGRPVPDRDLALAYAMMAQRDKSAAYQAKAESMLDKATHDAPDDVEVLLYLGELYRNTNRSDLAIPLFERAIKLNPEQVTASAGLGAILMDRGNFAEAIPLWEDALAKNAGLELVRVNLAMAYWRTGNLSAAEAHLKKAIDLSPGFASPADLLRQLRSQTPRK